MRKPIYKKASWPTVILLNIWRREMSDELYSSVSEKGGIFHLTNIRAHYKTTRIKAESKQITRKG